MGLLGDYTYGLQGPPHRRVGWISPATPFGKFRALRPVLRDGDSLLDVGCGTGMMVDWLRDNKFENVDYTGLDLSDSFLAEFAQRHPSYAGKLYRRNALSALPENAFDIVASFGLTSDLDSMEKAGSLVRNVVGACRDVGIIEFWDKHRFRPIGRGIPPMSWDPASVLEMAKESCPSCDVNFVSPLHKADFALVIFKE